MNSRELRRIFIFFGLIFVSNYYQRLYFFLYIIIHSENMQYISGLFYDMLKMLLFHICAWFSGGGDGDIHGDR